MNAAQVVEQLKQRFPNEPEYIQAVSQVLPTIEEEYNKHPEFEKANLDHCLRNKLKSYSLPIFFQQFCVEIVAENVQSGFR